MANRQIPSTVWCMRMCEISRPKAKISYLLYNTFDLLASWQYYWIIIIIPCIKVYHTRDLTIIWTLPISTPKPHPHLCTQPHKKLNFVLWFWPRLWPWNIMIWSNRLLVLGYFRSWPRESSRWRETKFFKDHCILSFNLLENLLLWIDSHSEFRQNEIISVNFIFEGDCLWMGWSMGRNQCAYRWCFAVQWFDGTK